MILKVVMKTPGSMDLAIDEVTEMETSEMEEVDDENWEEYDERKDGWSDFFKRWFKHGECITLEFDTENDTCKVLEE